MRVEIIEVGRIVEDADQPRRHHDADALQGLADSIRQHGVLQPITVAPLRGMDGYRIVTGERRWRAAQMVGLEVVPCIVRPEEPEDRVTEQLVENLQREDLQPLEKATAIATVKERLGATNREVAGRLGLSERTVGHLLDLLELPFEIGERVVSSPNRPADGQVTEKHARFLKQLNDAPELQSAVVGRIRDDRLSSDQAGRLVRALKQNPDRAEEIMASPADHLIRFFRAPELPESEPEAADAGFVPSARANRILDFLNVLQDVRPMDLPHMEVRQIEDALTSLKLAVDGLIRECRLELGEKA